MQAVVSEEPLETAVNPVDEEQTNDFGAKDQTMDFPDVDDEEDEEDFDENDEEDVDENDEEDLDEEDEDEEDEPDR